jgi:hypothetical protein
MRACRVAESARKESHRGSVSFVQSLSSFSERYFWFDLRTFFDSVLPDVNLEVFIHSAAFTVSCVQEDSRA